MSDEERFTITYEPDSLGGIYAHATVGGRALCGYSRNGWELARAMLLDKIREQVLNPPHVPEPEVVELAEVLGTREVTPA